MKAIVILSGIGFVLLYAIFSLLAGAFASVGIVLSLVALPFSMAAKGVLRARDWLMGDEHARI